MNENERLKDFIKDSLDDGIDESILKNDELLLKKIRESKQSPKTSMIYKVAAIFLISIGLVAYFNFHSVKDISSTKNNIAYSEIEDEDIQLVNVVNEIEFIDSMFSS